MKRLYLLGMGLVFATMSTAALACVHPNDIYYWTDKRDAEHYKFEEALNCQDLPPETLEMTIISLGRIGGEKALTQVVPYLKHDNPNIRQAASFAIGIGKVPAAGDEIIAALDSEKSPPVQYRLAMALGNMGHSRAQQVLTTIINQSNSAQKVRGALQGLVVLAAFHKDSVTSFDMIDMDKVIKHLKNTETELEASYLMARQSIIQPQHIDGLITLLPTLKAPSRANLIRALANTKNKRVLPSLLSKLNNSDNGIRVNAIRGLVNFPDNPVAIVGVLEAINVGGTFNQDTAKQETVTQVTVLQTINPSWLNNQALMKVVKAKLDSNNTWVQSEALLALVRGDKAPESLAKQWLTAKDPNLQRAAIAYFVKKNNTKTLKQLASNGKKIIENGAKQALNPEAETAEEPNRTTDAIPTLPALVELTTTKGTIKIELFADTAYTSANFIELIDNGFYNDSYFHRVIPNFVAQGGSNVGDGSGTVGYSIREELSYRSHLPGTVGMATLGKDTGGAQFFINIAPNLHLDSNYTIFGRVVDGMDVAMQLEQNDRVISAKTLTSK